MDCDSTTLRDTTLGLMESADALDQELVLAEVALPVEVRRAQEQLRKRLAEAQAVAGARRCRCGRVHSLEEWARLPAQGEAGRHRSAGAESWLELRLCHCGSTLAVQRWGVR